MQLNVLNDLAEAMKALDGKNLTSTTDTAVALVCVLWLRVVML